MVHNETLKVNVIRNVRNDSTWKYTSKSDDWRLEVMEKLLPVTLLLFPFFMTFFMVVTQEIIDLFWGICTKSCKVLAALTYV